MEQKIIFKIDINVPNMENIDNYGQKISSEFNAEILINEVDKKFNLQLKIFHQIEESLGEKLTSWYDIHKQNYLKYFNFKNSIEPSDIININFSKSDYSKTTCYGRTDSKESDIKYFLIELTSIEIIYENDSSNEIEFYLNEESFKLIEKNYSYSSIPILSEATNSFNWKPHNYIKDHITFGKISFKPEHHFSYKNNRSDNVTIIKEPKISVLPNKQDVEYTKKHVKLLCILLSFYSQVKIDYSLSIINREKESYYDFREIESYGKSDIFSLLKIKFRNKPFKFVESVNVQYLLDNIIFFEKIISRFNYALKTDGESKFMILYSLLEQIRNHYVTSGEITEKESTVKDKYSFKLNKKETNKYIKEKIESISEIIKEEDKELFLSEVSYKLSPLKYISMKNQFISLFNFLDLYPENFDLDFIELKKLRDTIFHGNPLDKNEELLLKINRSNKLPKFVSEVILKFCGI